ncbi:MAG: hypothetical protein ACP5N2_07040 [Candidatus Nanoarchaeia archaeon]
MKKTIKEKTIIINNEPYIIVKVLQETEILKEYTVKNNKGEEFLFELVLDKCPGLWKDSIISEKTDIPIRSFKFT